MRPATPGVDPGGCDVGRRGSGAPAQKAVTPLCPLSFESLRVLLCPLKVQMSVHAILNLQTQPLGSEELKGSRPVKTAHRASRTAECEEPPGSRGGGALTWCPHQPAACGSRGRSPLKRRESFLFRESRSRCRPADGFPLAPLESSIHSKWWYFGLHFIFALTPETAARA